MKTVPLIIMEIDVFLKNKNMAKFRKIGGKSKNKGTFPKLKVQGSDVPSFFIFGLFFEIWPYSVF